MRIIPKLDKPYSNKRVIGSRISSFFTVSYISVTFFNALIKFYKIYI